MKNLIYKELKLAAHPTNWIFLALSAMVLIPNYPYLVTFFYTGLGVFFLCLTGRETHDIDYTALLPVKKRDIVGARFSSIAIIELLQIAVTIPFAVIRCELYPVSEQMPLNQAGSMPSFAYFGMAFILLGVFNFVFLTKYYKNPDKVGRCFALAATAAFAIVILDVILSYVARPLFSSTGAVNLGAGLGILFGGIVIGVGLTAISYALSVKSFEKLDL